MGWITLGLRRPLLMVAVFDITASVDMLFSSRRQFAIRGVSWSYSCSTSVVDMGACQPLREPLVVERSSDQCHDDSSRHSARTASFGALVFLGPIGAYRGCSVVPWGPSSRSGLATMRRVAATTLWIVFGW